MFVGDLATIWLLLAELFFLEHALLFKADLARLSALLLPRLVLPFPIVGHIDLIGGVVVSMIELATLARGWSLPRRCDELGVSRGILIERADWPASLWRQSLVRLHDHEVVLGHLIFHMSRSADRHAGIVKRLG